MNRHELRFLSIISIIFTVFTTSLPASEKCNQEGNWAGFVVYSRIDGTPKDQVLQIANIVFPKQTFPELNKRSREITNEVYSWWKSKLNKYKPVNQKALIKAEKDFKSVCMKN